jgi:hypothetical protein
MFVEASTGMFVERAFENNVPFSSTLVARQWSLW